jgi:REP element-mobilizing transposase RayT
MPNHIHGIIFIEKSNDVAIGGNDAVGRDAINRVSTSSDAGTSSDAVKCVGGITGDKNPMLCDNLSRIVRWYKGRVSFESHKIYSDFGWQSRFHEHIIRNSKSHNRISDYIIKNAELWDEDKFNEKL